jgi:predicted transcriptional regulator
MTDTIPDVDLEKNFTFRMDQAMRDKIDRVAKAEDRSAGSAARVLIAEALRAREEKEQSK